MVTDLEIIILTVDSLSTSLALYAFSHFLDVQYRSLCLVQRQFFALLHARTKDDKKEYHSSHFAQPKQKECLVSLKGLKP